MGIIVNQVSYEYNKGTNQSIKALNKIDVNIEQGEFVAIIGQSGSGKSTLLKMMNGLLKPDEGGVFYNGEDIWDKDYNRVALRGKVGMVFQYPEHQLFESTVIKDVSFGPKNIGMKKLDVEFNSYKALKMVGIGEDLLDVSPFELSGGQKRRVAIAGVLAMKPEMIVLDEPAAGLDAKGKEKIFNILQEINEKNNTTVVFISHNMEDVVQYAKRVIVLDKGQVAMQGTVKEVFARKFELQSLGLGELPITELFDILKENGMRNLGNPLTVSEALEELYRYEMENC